MIRINLLKNVQGPASAVSDVSGFQVSDAPSRDTAGALKLFVAILMPVGFYYYSTTNLDNLRRQSAQVNSELEKVNTELNANSKVKETLDQLSASKKKLETQMDTIRKLNRHRLRHIKVLDAIQSIIPSGVWLQKASFDSEKVQMTGLSLNADEISTFVKHLEESVFFSEVLLTSTTDDTSNKGNYKKFELSCKLGDFQ